MTKDDLKALGKKLLTELKDGKYKAVGRDQVVNALKPFGLQDDEIAIEIVIRALINAL